MDLDVGAIASGIKSGFDLVRTALGLVRDVHQTFPPGEKMETVERTLAEADRQLRLGEAQIAQALGYSLCRCEFPPIPMLAVGYRGIADGGDYVTALASSTPGRVTIHECPTCGADDAGGMPYRRTTETRSARVASVFSFS